MPVEFKTSPVVEEVETRADVVGSLTDYYPRDSKNTDLYIIIRAIIDSVVDADNENVLTILDAGVDEGRTAALFPNFGYWFFQLQRRTDLNWGWDDYRFLLKVLGEAWVQYGTTNFGLRRVTQVCTGISPVILEHFRYSVWTLGRDTLGTGAFVQTGPDIWNSKARPVFAPCDLQDVWSAKQTDVWWCGTLGKIYHSIDAGETWTDESPGVVSTFYGASGAAPHNAWFCGSGGIIAQYDYLDAIHWTVSAVGVHDWRDIWMLNKNFGIAAGEGSRIAFWNGLTWTIQVLAVDNLYGVDGISEDLAFVVGNNGNVLRWNGTVWTHRPIGAAVSLRDVAVVDENTVWTCGNGGVVYYTTDAGLTWTLVDVGTIENLNGIAVSPDGTEIRVVGNQDILNYSSDSGATWTNESFEGLGLDFKAIDMRPNFTMGYIAGEFEVLLRRNGQSPGYTFVDGTYLPNNSFVERAVIESRKGRRNSVDVIVWNVDDYNLLWLYLNEMKAAHIKIYPLIEVPFLMDYYYEYESDFWVNLEGTGVVSSILGYDRGLSINGRPYGDSTYMSRIVIGQDDLLIPQLN